MPSKTPRQGQLRGQGQSATAALRGKATLAADLERLEGELLASLRRLGCADLNAAFDLCKVQPGSRKAERAHSLMLDVLDVQRRRHDIWQPGASRALHDARLFINAKRQRMQARREQQGAVRIKHAERLQPLADRIPKNLSALQAARRIAALQESEDGPKADTIRKLIVAGVIKYQTRKLARG